MPAGRSMTRIVSAIDRDDRSARLIVAVERFFVIDRTTHATHARSIARARERSHTHTQRHNLSRSLCRSMWYAPCPIAPQVVEHVCEISLQRAARSALEVCDGSASAARGAAARF